MAVPNHPVFGCTDETYGYFRKLVFRAVNQVKESADGAGVIKFRDSYGLKTICEGEYVYRADDSAVSGKVGTDTALTISDADSPGNIYIDEYTIDKTGGESPDSKVCRFVGVYYANLSA